MPEAESDTAGRHQLCGVFVFLLPYVEATAVSQQFSSTIKVGVDIRDENYYRDVHAWSMAQARIPGFICPSVPNDYPSTGILDKSYGILKGGFLALQSDAWDPEQTQLGLTHYMGISGVWGEVASNLVYNMGAGPRNVNDNLLGVFSVRSKVTLGQVPDGTSQTLMFGEAPGSIGVGIPDDFKPGTFTGVTQGNAWAGFGTLPTALGLNVSLESKNGALYDAKWSYYGSLHSGSIVQFCFVDGSTRSLTKDVDLTAFQTLSTRSGAEVVDANAP